MWSTSRVWDRECSDVNSGASGVIGYLDPPRGGCSMMLTLGCGQLVMSMLVQQLGQECTSNVNSGVSDPSVSVPVIGILSPQSELHHDVDLGMWATSAEHACTSHVISGTWDESNSPGDGDSLYPFVPVEKVIWWFCFDHWLRNIVPFRDDLWWHLPSPNIIKRSPPEMIPCGHCTARIPPTSEWHNVQT